MKLSNAQLHKHTFRLHGRPLTFVQSPSRQAALTFLNGIVSNGHGLGVLKGPPLVGKTTLIQQFVPDLPSQTAVAVLDCINSRSECLLASILLQFGFELDHLSSNDRLKILKVFLVRQIATFHASLLFIENAHALDPTAKHVLRQLMRVKHNGERVLDIVLVSDRSLDDVTSAIGMVASDGNRPEHFQLGPMTAAETENYIYTKLHSGGCHRPENIVPEHLYRELFAESEGYPGLVDRLMLLRLKETNTLPLGSKYPSSPAAKGRSLIPVEDMMEPAELAELIVTCDGKTLHRIKLNQARILVGRSELNDITIDSTFVSRSHALLIRQGRATVLLDLNSTNGTFVNSRRVTCHALRHDDVITLGNHSIKMFDVNLRQRPTIDGTRLNDTATMQAIDDQRNGAAMKAGHPVHPAVKR